MCFPGNFGVGWDGTPIDEAKSAVASQKVGRGAGAVLKMEMAPS